MGCPAGPSNLPAPVPPACGARGVADFRDAVAGAQGCRPLAACDCATGVKAGGPGVAGRGRRRSGEGRLAAFQWRRRLRQDRPGRPGRRGRAGGRGRIGQQRRRQHLGDDLQLRPQYRDAVAGSSSSRGRVRMRVVRASSSGPWLPCQGRAGRGWDRPRIWCTRVLSSPPPAPSNAAGTDAGVQPRRSVPGHSPGAAPVRR